MRKDQELIVITKTYDLILWSCSHTSKFPRNHRFVLGERIERNLYGLLETLIAARYTKREVPDTHYSGWRWESKGLRGSVNLILLSIGGTMITASVLSLGAFDASSIDACLRSPRDRGR